MKQQHGNRKRFFNCLLLGMILIGFTNRLSAQGNRFQFSLEECVQFALDNNTNIKNAQLEAYQSQTQVNQILSSGYPQLKGSANITYFPEVPVSVLPGELNFIEPGVPAAVQFGTPWQSSVGVSLSQLAFDGTFFIGLKAAREVTKLSRKNTNRTREETALAVSKAYYSAMIAQESLNILQANIERVTKLYEDTKALNESGFVEKIDVERLQISLANLNIQRVKTEGFGELSLDLLKFQMGMPISAVLELNESTEDLDITTAPIEDVNSFNPSNRIEYSMLQKQHELQVFNMRRFKAGYLPTLYANGALSYNAYRQEFDIFSNERWFPTANIGLQLNIPIFDGFMKRNQVNEVKFELTKIENSIETLENSILLELKSTRTSLRDAFISLESLKNNARLAQKVFAVTDIKYKEGVGSSLELNNAESQLKESESAYLSGLLEYLLAKVDYQKARGEFAKYHRD